MQIDFFVFLILEDFCIIFFLISIQGILVHIKSSVHHRRPNELMKMVTLH